MKCFLLFVNENKVLTEKFKVLEEKKRTTQVVRTVVNEDCKRNLRSYKMENLIGSRLVSVFKTSVQFPIKNKHLDINLFQARFSHLPLFRPPLRVRGRENPFVMSIRVMTSIYFYFYFFFSRYLNKIFELVVV